MDAVPNGPRLSPFDFRPESYGADGLGFDPLKRRYKPAAPPPMKAAATAGGIPVGGIAAAPAAPQSTADAPAPASTAAPWLMAGAAPGLEQTSTDPPVAAGI